MLGDGVAIAVALKPDGKIVVAGRAVVNANQQFAIVRYNTNGSRDTAFDGNGQVHTLFEPFGATNVSEAFDLTIQPDGKIVAVRYVRWTNTDGGPSVCDRAMAR